MKRRGFLQALCASVLTPAGSVLSAVFIPSPSVSAIPTRKPYYDGSSWLPWKPPSNVNS